MPNSIITPLEINGLILWDYIFKARHYKPFLMLGDCGLYCPIKYGRP